HPMPQSKTAHRQNYNNPAFHNIYGRGMQMPQPTSVSVQIYWDCKTQLYRIHAPYEKNFVDKFKALIPYQDRGWDATTRTWAFTEPWLTQVELLIQQIWSHFEEILTSRGEAEQEARRYAAEALPAETFTKDQK